jgi:hypothetical protein
MKIFCQSIFIALLFTICAAAQTRLAPHKITLKSGKTFNSNAPADYEIEGVSKVLTSSDTAKHARVNSVIAAANPAVQVVRFLWTIPTTANLLR